MDVEEEIDWKGATRPVERDVDGWMPSFDTNDERLVEFLAQHSFVVLNVLNAEEVAETIKSFWEMCREYAVRKGRTVPVPNDPRTWEDGNWPAKGKFLFDEDAVTQQAFNNRTHPKLYEAFRMIFKKDVLLAKIDKWGCMRGTVFDSELFPATGGIREDWRWELLPHWDCNPHEYNDELKRGLPRMYQGLIALKDCFDDPVTGVTTGGFRAAAGTANVLDQWCAQNPNARRPADEKWSHYPPKSDPLYHRLQKIPLKAGQCVIWDAGCLHANFHNNSSELRIVQFVRMIDPAGCEQIPLRTKFFPTKEQIPKNIVLTPLGKKLLGVVPWEGAKAVVAAKGQHNLNNDNNHHKKK